MRRGERVAEPGQRRLLQVADRDRQLVALAVVAHVRDVADLAVALRDALALQERGGLLAERPEPLGDLARLARRRPRG